MTPTTLHARDHGRGGQARRHRRAPAPVRHPGARAHGQGRHRARPQDAPAQGRAEARQAARGRRAARTPGSSDSQTDGPAEHHSRERRGTDHAGQDLLRPGRRPRAAQGQEGRHHRLRQPGPRPRAEPEGLRPGRGRRPVQGLQELGQGGEGRAQGDAGGGRRPGGRRGHDPAARPDAAPGLRGRDQGRAWQGQDAHVRARLQHPLQPGGAHAGRGRVDDRAQGARPRDARPLHPGPRRPRPGRGVPGRLGQGARHGPRLRQGRRLHAGGRDRDDVQGRDRDRPLRRADHALRRRLAPDQGRASRPWSRPATSPRSRTSSACTR